MNKRIKELAAEVADSYAGPDYLGASGARGLKREIEEAIHIAVREAKGTKLDARAQVRAELLRARGVDTLNWTVADFKRHGVVD